MKLVLLWIVYLLIPIDLNLLMLFRNSGLLVYILYLIIL
nr:MAG TPA: hypothetical protein [Caudoviricetes sp.]